MKYEDPQQAIDAGHQGLQPPNGFPWYDPAKDSLRRVDVRPPEKATIAPVSPTWNFLIYSGALVLLALLLAALASLILRAMGISRQRGNRGEPLVVGDAERIEALACRRRGKLSLLDQARNFYQAGNYAAATIYLFSHQLVQLDRHQIIRLAKGKTNREYLREVGGTEVLRQLVGQTLVAFEDVFFGHHDIDRGRFESCWSRLPEFESLLARGIRSA